MGTHHIFFFWCPHEAGVEVGRQDGEELEQLTRFSRTEWKGTEMEENGTTINEFNSNERHERKANDQSGPETGKRKPSKQALNFTCTYVCKLGPTN